MVHLIIKVSNVGTVCEELGSRENKMIYFSHSVLNLNTRYSHVQKQEFQVLIIALRDFQGRNVSSVEAHCS